MSKRNAKVITHQIISLESKFWLSCLHEFLRMQFCSASDCSTQKSPHQNGLQVSEARLLIANPIHKRNCPPSHWLYISHEWQKMSPLCIIFCLCDPDTASSIFRLSNSRVSVPEDQNKSRAEKLSDRFKNQNLYHLHQSLLYRKKNVYILLNFLAIMVWYFIKNKNATLLLSFPRLSSACLAWTEAYMPDFSMTESLKLANNVTKWISSQQDRSIIFYFQIVLQFSNLYHAWDVIRGRLQLIK